LSPFLVAQKSCASPALCSHKSFLLVPVKQKKNHLVRVLTNKRNVLGPLQRTIRPSREAALRPQTFRTSRPCCGQCNIPDIAGRALHSSSCQWICARFANLLRPGEKAHRTRNKSALAPPAFSKKNAKAVALNFYFSAGAAAGLYGGCV
jgi:hypothetical protein